MPAMGGGRHERGGVGKAGRVIDEPRERRYFHDAFGYLPAYAAFVPDLALRHWCVPVTVEWVAA